MKTLGIIPARFASTRFPEKMLADLCGHPLLWWVWQNAQKCIDLDDLVIATDHQKIVDAARNWGAKVILTDPNHPSGSDRCAEALSKMSEDFDLVINIQGDEPLIDPEHISKVIKVLKDGKNNIATLCVPIDDSLAVLDLNVVKVLRDGNQAILFSRSPLPFQRDQPENWLEKHSYYRHLGMYGYQTAVLKEIVKLPVSSWEAAEKLEQLRWLQAGYRIGIEEVEKAGLGVDTPEDLLKVTAVIKGA